MHTKVVCGQCRTKLLTKAELAGQTVRCPRCSHAVLVTVAAGMMVRPSTPIPKQGSVAPAPVAAPIAEPETVEAILLPDETDASSSENSQLGANEKQAHARAKKKKKLKTKVETKVPVWMWIAGCIGGLFTAGGIFFAIYLALTVGDVHGDGPNWFGLVFQFAIGTPVSLIILISSIYVGRALGIGIDLGEAKLAIVGALFLVVIVNLFTLIPFVGFWLTWLVWIAGLMSIFGLDIWEARFLLIINIVLNYILHLILLSFLLQAVEKMKQEEMEKEEEEVPINQPRRDPNWKEREPGVPRKIPGGDDDDLSWRFDEVHELMRAWIERQGMLRVG